MKRGQGVEAKNERGEKKERKKQGTRNVAKAVRKNASTHKCTHHRNDIQNTVIGPRHRHHKANVGRCHIVK